MRGEGRKNAIKMKHGLKEISHHQLTMEDKE